MAEKGTERRLAAVVVPEFPSALLVREHPEYADRPVIISAGTEGVDPVVSCNAKAAEVGIAVGCTTAEAKMRVDNLAVGIQDSEQETAVSSRLINSLQNISPFVEEDVPGTYFVQVSGMLLLYKTEQRFARLALKAVRHHRLPAAVGVASNKYVALVAAAVAEKNRSQDTEPVVIVPDRQEQSFLASLSIDFLPVSPETKDKLRLLGIHQIGRVSRFAANELISRFETDGTILARLSHGCDNKPLMADIPPEDIAAVRSFLTPLETAKEITFHVKEMLIVALEQLRSRSHGCGCVELELTCEDPERGGTRLVELSLAVETPGLDPKPFIRQLQQKLSGLRLRGGVTDLRVHIPQVGALLGEQISLSCVIRAANALPSHQLMISSQQQAIYVPQTRTAALPEQSFELVPYEQGRKKRKATGSTAPSSPAGLPGVPYTGRSLTGLRLIHPAQPVKVTCRAGKVWQVKINARLCRVEAVRGPWRLSGRWWARPFDRQYFEIETENRYRYLLYCQGEESPQWYLQGLFD